MKTLRVIGSILLGLAMVASVLAPAEVQAVVPVSAHDFLFGDGGATLGMATVSLASLSRLERQKSNLGGFAKLYLYGASDFTEDWPKEADAKTGTLATPLPLKVGVTAAVLTIDIGSGRGKYSMKGKLGYQNVDHEIEAKFAGYEETQLAMLQNIINEGGVAIGVLKNGKRVVYGSSYTPLEFEDMGDTGAKADDQLSISLKGKGTDGYAFRPPVLATAVVLALPVVV